MKKPLTYCQWFLFVVGKVLEIVTPLKPFLYPAFREGREVFRFPVGYSQTLVCSVGGLCREVPDSLREIVQYNGCGRTHTRCHRLLEYPVLVFAYSLRDGS